MPFDVVLGRKDVMKIKSTSPHTWKMKNALKLVAEVVPLFGGRTLCLRSPFTVENNTDHTIDLMEYPGSEQTEDWRRERPFRLAAKARHRIPLALLHKSVLDSDGNSLGCLRIRPAEV